LLIRAYVLRLFGVGNKKTHDRCQPWVFVEIVLLPSTSRHGVAYYDDNQRNVPNNKNHVARKLATVLARVKRRFAAFQTICAIAGPKLQTVHANWAAGRNTNHRSGDVLFHDGTYRSVRTATPAVGI